MESTTVKSIKLDIEFYAEDFRHVVMDFPQKIKGLNEPARRRVITDMIIHAMNENGIKSRAGKWEAAEVECSGCCGNNVIYKSGSEENGKVSIITCELWKPQQ